MCSAQQDEKRQKQVLEEIRTESTRDTQRVLAQQKREDSAESETRCETYHQLKG